MNAAVLCRIPDHESSSSSRDECHALETLSHKSNKIGLVLKSSCGQGDSHECNIRSVLGRFLLPQEGFRLTSSSRAFNTPQSYDTSVRKSVCTVQTFRNGASDAMLYLFARYYLEAGWIVIIYDRFGQHEDVISLLRGFGDRLLYHPYTILEIVFPHLYNAVYAASQV